MPAPDPGPVKSPDCGDMGTGTCWGKAAARDGVACMDAYAKHLRQRLASHGPQKRRRRVQRFLSVPEKREKPREAHMHVHIVQHVATYVGDPLAFAKLRASA